MNNTMKVIIRNIDGSEEINLGAYHFTDIQPLVELYRKHEIYMPSCETAWFYGTLIVPGCNTLEIIVDYQPPAEPPKEG